MLVHLGEGQSQELDHIIRHHHTGFWRTRADREGERIGFVYNGQIQAYGIISSVILSTDYSGPVYH